MALTAKSTLAEFLKEVADLGRDPKHRGPVEVSFLVGEHTFTLQVSIKEIDGVPVVPRGKH